MINSWIARNAYPLITLTSDEGLVALAQWILQFGTDHQKDFVRGELHKL